MERVTEEQIEEMRRNGYDRSTIAEARAWLALCEVADELILKIDAAFDGVKLEEGIGLRESNGIDDYAGEDELRRLRETDEKEDWRRITPDLLTRCNAAPSFLDGKGLRFHAPAFMIAELRGQFHHDFIDRLVHGFYDHNKFKSLLTPQQRSVIIDCIRFYGDIEQCSYSRTTIERAISRFS